MPPRFEIPPGVCWCPHYPAPYVPIKAVYNCIECMMCYRAPSEEEKRPHVAFMLHTTHKHDVLTRQHYPRGFWRDHPKPLCKRRLWIEPIGEFGEWDAEAPPEETCGFVTPYGWYAPDDDA